MVKAYKFRCKNPQCYLSKMFIRTIVPYKKCPNCNSTQVELKEYEYPEAFR